MNHNTAWRNDKPTNAQLQAIFNISHGWRIPYNSPLTKGEANDELERLTAIVHDIKSRRTAEMLRSGRLDKPTD